MAGIVEHLSPIVQDITTINKAVEDGKITYRALLEELPYITEKLHNRTALSDLPLIVNGETFVFKVDANGVVTCNDVAVEMNALMEIKGKIDEIYEQFTDSRKYEEFREVIISYDPEKSSSEDANLHFGKLRLASGFLDTMISIMQDQKVLLQRVTRNKNNQKLAGHKITSELKQLSIQLLTLETEISRQCRQLFI